MDQAYFYVCHELLLHDPDHSSSGMAKQVQQKMTKDEVMLELSGLGNEQTKKVLTRHGAREPFFGVKIADLKTLVKRIKKDHQLALALYRTGNSDAMYLAGLIADEQIVTRAELQDWVKGAYWYLLAEYTVPRLAAESPHGWELGLEWIESPVQTVASAGWSTLSNVVSLRPDEDLDLQRLSQLLDRIAGQIHRSQNRVRYSMNGFVIAVGGYVTALTGKASEVAGAMGKVFVDMVGTACKVPPAVATIKKMEDRGYIGRKRKAARN
jgi:3-methyladenine DNA glycosylase AlkD